MIKATTALNQDLLTGQLWRMGVEMDGTDTPVLVIVLPDGTPLAPATTFSSSDDGWLAEYTPTEPGRHVAVVTTAEDSTVAFQAWVSDVAANSDYPDAAALDNFLGGAGQHSWSDPDLTEALEIEGAAQRRVCNIPASFDPDLRGALLRRAARYLNLKRQLTEQPRSEGGDFDLPPVAPPGRDAEIRRLEAPWRRTPIG